MRRRCTVHLCTVCRFVVAACLRALAAVCRQRKLCFVTMFTIIIISACLIVCAMFIRSHNTLLPRPSTAIRHTGHKLNTRATSEAPIRLPPSSTTRSQNYNMLPSSKRRAAESKRARGIQWSAERRKSLRSASKYYPQSRLLCEVHSRRSGNRANVKSSV